ncbi:MAG TPA: DNA polymerase III subunit alpha [Pseudogracilibacillus sp.]|nr:DNA polymerase III subunit alpha [Pseudogracilibacillus sp.]
MSFTHLQVKSGYSLYQSTMTIDRLVQQANALQFDAIALTDEAVLYGVIPFYEACKQHGIKPIIGMEVKVEIEEVAVPLLLYAKSNDGYRELMKISTHIQTSETVNILAHDFSELIAILPTEIEAVQEAIVNERLTTRLQAMFETLASDDFYFGITSNASDEWREVLTEKEGFSVLAVEAITYAKAQDRASYDCLQAMKNNEKWDAQSVNHDQVTYMKSKAEMEMAFEKLPQALAHTKDIVEKCQVTFDFTRQLLPAFPVAEGETAASYLRNLCEQQLQVKYEENEAARERLEEELTIIDQLGFNDYFLIVQDFVQFAKDEDIVVGPGRGSAAGSIVSYLLGITNVDPLKYDLLFERFLNPERVSLPDIDIDFSDIRRDEVIQYVKNKYGSEYVAQIITFGTFAARSLMRELMKTLDVHDEDQQYVLKNIPVNRSEPLITFIEGNEDFKSYIKQSKKLRLLFSIAMKLEGLPRHVSTHAAGVVIGKHPLMEDVPLIKAANDTFLTQYAMNELEKIGLLKMDILGLKNLTLIERITKTIAHDRKEQIDIENIPENDAKTFALLQQAKTNGIFQLESAGMKNALRKIKPTSLNDIIDLNALYRPGPMEFIDIYAKRKHGEMPIQYIHDDLQAILEGTYGVLIYQEQIMQIAHQFAGLTLGQADILRRAVSKKDRQEMDKMQDVFIRGCLAKGYDRTIAEEVFSWIVQFANYGFNKSHSVAYSKVSYQLAYLKANYPTPFFAQILNTTTSDPAKLSMYVQEAKEANIAVLPPSINDSFPYFSVEAGNIRIGLLAIKGIGYETAKEIMDVRKNGKFRDLFDFIQRTKNIKRNVIETLILAGSFDDLYDNRASLLASIDKAYERTELFGQNSLFTEKMEMRADYIVIDDFTRMEKLQKEKELVHLYLSSHPFEKIRTSLAVHRFIPVHEMKNLRDNSKVKTVAIVQSFRKISTKRGDSMAFATIADEFDEIDVVVFPDTYREVSPWFKEEVIVAMGGKVNTRENKRQLIVNKMSPFDVAAWEKAKNTTLYIKLTEEMDRNQAMQKMRNIAQQYKGDTPIIVYDEAAKKTYRLGENYYIQQAEQAIILLENYFGASNVILK